MKATRALMIVAACASIAALTSSAVVAPAWAEVKAPRKKHKEPTEPAQPAPPPAAPAPQAAAPAQPPVVFSPWTKLCPKPPPNAPQGLKQVCLTVKEARLETGQFIAGAALIEQAGEEKKLLRVTLPLGMQIPPGTRVTLDAEPPISGPFVVCVPNGCMADYQIDTAFVAKLKKGTQLLLQGINMSGQVAGYLIPLQDFAKAIDGPAADPEEFEKRQKAEWEQRLKQHQQQVAPK